MQQIASFQELLMEHQGLRRIKLNEILTRIRTSLRLTAVVQIDVMLCLRMSTQYDSRIGSHSRSLYVVATVIYVEKT